MAGLAAVPDAEAASKAVPDAWSSESAGAGQSYANTGESAITPGNAATLALKWQTPNGGSFVAPSVVGGRVYRPVNSGSALTPATFSVSSARTGARAWSVKLPESQYFRGQSIASGIAVLPFEGWHELGGVTAVDLTTHKVLWSRSRPASTTEPGNDDGTGGPVVIDAGRVYLLAGNNDLTAYDLRTGALLWHDDPSAGVRSIAAGGGRLYTGGYPSGGGPGLVAYNGANGKKLWSAPALVGQPVVDGSAVLATTYQGVGSVPATGCGKATCAPTWTRTLDAEPGTLALGGATSSSFFVAYEPATSNTGRLARVNARTGAVQWTYRAPQPLGQVPIRAGSIVWTLTDIHTVKGWSVGATSTTPVRTITLPTADDGVVGGLAGANGGLYVDIFGGALAAYRLPNR